METNRIITGDVFDVLPELPKSCVHMVMTSPPYYGLRDYGVEGQIGLEETLAEYIERLVAVGDELRRVLRDDGSWWLNLGDSYAQSGRSNHDKSGTAPDGQGHARGHSAGGFVSKQKMLVPHRAAIALQEAGWIVRNDAVWAKPNPMPESVTDRLSTTFEFVFHLTPNPDYWYDLDSIREPYSEDSLRESKYNWSGNGSKTGKDARRDAGVRGVGGPGMGSPDKGRDDLLHPAGKNPGDVFEVTTKPYPDAHFAVYPPELCKKPIKATCPKDGIVLDPFAGAGTTCLVAKQLGRRFIGIELNPKYSDMARARLGLDVHDPSHLRDGERQSGMESFTDA